MSLTGGIIGCWSPSLGATGYLLRDVSGQNNHGTLTNMDPGTDWVASEKGLALDFDGSNDYIQTAPARGLQGANSEVTFAAWVSVKAGYHKLFDDLSGLNGVIWYVATTGNLNGGQQIALGGKYPMFSNTRLTANRWAFVSFSWKNPQVTFYLNGNVDGVTTGTNNPTFSVSQFRWGGSGGLETTNGNVGECCLWSRSLEASEHLELYRRGNGWLGRELTGMNQRRTYAKKLGNRRRRLLCGGMI